MRYLLCALLISVSVGCSPMDTAPRVRADTAASIGEAWSVGNLVVTPQRIIEDSRCPVDVTCVWAGRVVLRVLVADKSQSQTIDLILGEPTTLYGGMLTLETVTPAQMAEMEIRPRSYRFTFSYE